MTHRGRPASAVLVVVLWVLLGAAPTGAGAQVGVANQDVANQDVANRAGAAQAVVAPVGSPAQDDDPARCRTIIGCAEAGPQPENPGDRGGYAQLLTLVVLFSGVGFIMTKVLRAARSSQPGPPG